MNGSMRQRMTKIKCFQEVVCEKNMKESKKMTEARKSYKK
jgi:hypothetical protein